MSHHAFVKLVEGSTRQEITLSEVQDHLQTYIDRTAKTGQQLGWTYDEAAFPYTIEQIEEQGERLLYLKGKDPELYRYILMGVGFEDVSLTEEEQEETNEPVRQHYIEIALPRGATHGDKGKANEFCKYLAKELKAKLHLFNGRIMYFNPLTKKKKK